MLKKFALGASVAALAAMAPVSAVYAQQTDATVRGTVVDGAGNAIAGATVTFIDTRTNAVASATTTAAGNFARTNLRVGGPYTVTVSAPGFQGAQLNIGSLNIGSNPALNLSLDAAVSDVITVVGARIANPLEIQNGVGTAFSAEDIADTPILDRDLTNIIELDPLVSVGGAPGESGVVSFGGIEPRLNGFTVDGALIADRFKLEEAFYPTLRQPISLDVIEAVAATYAEYSVLTTGAQGGLVNTVTKSGSNEFDGVAFFRYGDDSFEGSDSGFENDSALSERDFEETEWGITVSGPIIQDRLFFVASYEEFELTDPDVYALTQSELDQFEVVRQAILANPAFGDFDPGVKTNLIDDTRTSERFFGKLDWQINDDHRASLWYTTIEEQRLQNRGSYFLEFPSAAYDRTTEIDMYHGQLVSDWTDNLSTTFRVIYKEQVNGQIPRVGLTNGVTDFGTFLINDAVDGQRIQAGSDPFRHANAFEDEQLQLFGSADYIWNDHVITIGAEYQTYELLNLFGQFCRGQFEFDSVADVALGNAEVDYRNLPGNNCLDRVADWGFNKLDLFIQDEWQLTPDLSINYGLRYERFSSDDSPAPGPIFDSIYGANSAGDLDGLDILQPRFGFNWSAPYDVNVQGGVGLFAGGDPVVWFSNAFSPLDTLASGTFTGITDFGSVPQDLLDLVDQNTGPFNFDHIDPDFNVPSIWKASLSLDRAFDFGPLGSDYLLGLSIAYSKVNDGAAFINRAQLADEIIDTTVAADVAAGTGVAPDGRPIYIRSRGDAIQLINSDEGESLAVSFSAQKEFDFGLTVTGSYTYTDSERLIPGSSSRHISNYRSLVSTDRNSAAPAGRSVFEIEDRFVFTAKYENEFIRDLETQIVLKGIIESGDPYNIGFAQSSANRIFGRAAGGSPFSGVDLLYVPLLDSSGSGFDDPIVLFESAADEAEIFAILEEEGVLGRAGGFTEKNSQTTGWNQRFDLAFTQELPGIPGAERFVGENRVKLDIDIFNVANLLNSDWGTQTDGVRFDSISPVNPNLITAADAAAYRAGTLTDITSAYINASSTGSVCKAAGDCVYVYESGFGGARVQERLEDSVWKVRVGLRYEF